MNASRFTFSLRKDVLILFKFLFTLFLKAQTIVWNMKLCALSVTVNLYPFFLQIKN